MPALEISAPIAMTLLPFLDGRAVACASLCLMRAGRQWLHPRRWLVIPEYRRQREAELLDPGSIASRMSRGAR
jgi:hypothetical protein